MANWGMMRVVAPRQMSPEEVLSLSQGVWDAMDCESMFDGGRDGCITSSDGNTLWVHLFFHEIGWSSGWGGLLSIDAVVRVAAAIQERLIGCRVEVSGQSDGHGTWTELDHGKLLELIDLRHELAEKIREEEKKKVG